MSDQPLFVSGRLAVVWVAGPDTISFLDGLLSQNIAAIPVGGTGRSLLLAPNGKLRGILFVLRGDDRVGLVGDAARAEAVAGDLRRFKIRVDVEIAVDDAPVWEIWGDDVPGIDYPEPGRWVSDGEATRFRMPFLHSATNRTVVVGATNIGRSARASDVEVRRIEMGEPTVGVDLDEKTIPQEGIAVADFVDFTKGCYLGQELVARIETRGHVNRRLTGLIIGTDTPPPAGTAVTVDSRDVGTVTSAAFSSSMQSVIALAMVRTDVEVGDAVQTAGVTGEVVGLPITS